MDNINIFESHNMPYKDFRGEVYWFASHNWAVEINGERFYGAGSKKDLERVMAPVQIKTVDDQQEDPGTENVTRKDIAAIPIGRTRQGGITVPLKVRNNDWWRN